MPSVVQAHRIVQGDEGGLDAYHRKVKGKVLPRTGHEGPDGE